MIVASFVPGRAVAIEGQRLGIRTESTVARSSALATTLPVRRSMSVSQTRNAAGLLVDAALDVHRRQRADQEQAAWWRACCASAATRVGTEVLLRQRLQVVAHLRRADGLAHRCWRRSSGSITISLRLARPSVRLRSRKSLPAGTRHRTSRLDRVRGDELGPARGSRGGERACAVAAWRTRRGAGVARSDRRAAPVRGRGLRRSARGRYGACATLGSRRA